jgi:hypothetical protein
MTNYKLKMESGEIVKVRVNPVSLTHSWEYVKRNRPLQVVLGILTFGAPVLGFFVSGLAGVIVGGLLALVCWVLGPRAYRRVRERETR